MKLKFSLFTCHQEKPITPNPLEAFRHFAHSTCMNNASKCGECWTHHVFCLAMFHYIHSTALMLLFLDEQNERTSYCQTVHTQHMQVL